MVARCTSALSNKYLPRGLRGQLSSRVGCLQAARSRVDAASSLQGEAQVHYPNLHENPKTNTSPNNTLHIKFCHWIKPT